MRFSAATVLAALPFLHTALASDVLDLTQSDFQSEILGEDLALVEFFAPWCGHCKNLAPHYEEAATDLKPKNIKLAKVDCTEQQPLCTEYGVSGYPTLKVFRNGSPTDYAGPRKADGIISYMVKQSLPAISQVTAASHDEFTKSDKVVLVSYGDSISGFDAYANSARDSYLFGHYVDSNLPKLPESVSLPAIVLYKSFDEGYAVFPADKAASATAEQLADFVKENSVPLFDEISPENFGLYAGQGLPIAYLFADPEQSDSRDKLVNELAPLAKELKGQASFVYIDAIKFAEHGKSLNLNGDSWPAFVIQDLAEGTKYPLPETPSKSAIEKFVKSYIKGDIQPSIKSEPVPAANNEPVFHLVSDQWDEVFGDQDKDVFAEFFAPWCGHCQRLAPVWETLGEKYAKNSNVVIAQMDATLNDVPPSAPFKVQGFPTLKFKPAGGLEFIDYNGDRSLESLIEFVETNKKSVAADGADDAEYEDDDAEVVEHDEL